MTELSHRVGAAEKNRNLPSCTGSISSSIKYGSGSNTETSDESQPLYDNSQWPLKNVKAQPRSKTLTSIVSQSLTLFRSEVADVKSHGRLERRKTHPRINFG
ncbi:hypothetical protein TRICI_003347 [Trichomonascus ciferrii]|uniref:Uncharacterized protein n=1 Tax=Trichomonascus ciferrii TaxID=44093 RepID=A0A642V5A8_9ASCO|nr:hypothetical protein TRICI_003347 [Trichomonascus ciferrii]